MAYFDHEDAHRGGVLLNAISHEGLRQIECQTFGATYSFAAAAIADWAEPEMSGRSDTLGRCFNRGAAETLTFGVPVRVTVKFLIGKDSQQR